jgi:hypothetical protein
MSSPVLFSVKVTFGGGLSMDTMIALEEEINLIASAAEDVDGHEIGVDGFSIFISSKTPKSTLKKIIAVLNAKDYCGESKVYCRRGDSEETEAWPNPG